jgi:hypothetical protein
VPQPEAKTK